MVSLFTMIDSGIDESLGEEVCCPLIAWSPFLPKSDRIEGNERAWLFKATSEGCDSRVDVPGPLPKKSTRFLIFLLTFTI